MALNLVELFINLLAVWSLKLYDHEYEINSVALPIQIQFLPNDVNAIAR